MKIQSTLFFLLFISTLTTAQEFSYGFKAGLNFSQLSADSEINDAGTELEEYDTATGFHIGAIFNLKFIDRFGIRSELMFSQKGTEYVYDGGSYRSFTGLDETTFTRTGNRRTVLNATNSYIDIPFLAYTRLGKLELAAGPSIGFLVNSVASGETIFTVQDMSGNEVATITTLLDYNYNKDEAGMASLEGTSQVEIGNRTAIIPEAEGAYIEFEDADGRFYNTIDVGLNAQIAYFLNRGLFVAGRLNYGLTDATNNDFDRSLQSLLDGEFISREDADSNLSIQVSLGFSF